MQVAGSSTLHTSSYAHRQVQQFLTPVDNLLVDNHPGVQPVATLACPSSHTPNVAGTAEHTIDGQRAALELQFMHESAAAELAAVAVLFDVSHPSQALLCESKHADHF